jgi:hypothetical protein
MGVSVRSIVDDITGICRRIMQGVGIDDGLRRVCVGQTNTAYRTKCSGEQGQMRCVAVRARCIKRGGVH